MNNKGNRHRGSRSGWTAIARRGFLLAVILGVALPSATAAAAANAPSPDRPNFILCMADDQGWGDMAYNGHPVVKTPNFDELARTGLRFDRFYAGAPVCSPTRASVLTGRTPNRMGAFSWGNTLRPQEITVAETLKAAGYATGHFGKWHLGSVRPDSPVNPGASGFAEWFSSPNFFEIDPWMSHNGKAVKTTGEGSEVIVDAALKFIRTARDAKQPFLAVVWFGSPHDPHVGTPEDLALYPDQPKAQQNFLAEITAMDRAMGKLRKQLRELGAADNTVLWYCSDNGAIKQGSTGGLRGGKNTVWEGGLRVPGLLEWPARLRQPRVIHMPCGTVDILPTLLELAGAKPAKLRPLDGISLVPLLEGRMSERPKPMGFWHYAIGGVGVKSSELLEQQAKEQAEGKLRPWSEVQPIPESQLRSDYPTDLFPGHSAWLDGDWKLHRIEPKKGAPKWELYHLAEDRVEARDLAAAQPERLAKMQRELDGWLKSVVNSLNGADYK
jgi:arylsulfatase A-like enzyme